MPALDAEGYQHWLGALVPEGPVEGGSDPGLLAVMKRVGPAIWLGHSQAGTTGGRLSNRTPEFFKAVIGIEPQGACNLPPDMEIKGVTKVPQFSIHGINQVGRPDTAPCLDTYAKINAAGTASDPWTAPLPGLYGAGTAGNILGNRLDAVVSTRSTAVDVRISTPSAVRNRAISAEISGSSRPAICGPRSITVTALPNRP